MSRASPPQPSRRYLDPSGYLSEKTIVALSSPTGGALTILRVSGKDTKRIAKSLTRVDLVERLATRVSIQDQTKRAIDDAVAVFYQGPRSFSGEDTLELMLHGSPRIAQRAMEEIIGLGARPALPGEFSFRAVKNGRLSLSQAEAIKDLIEADNDFSLDLALEKLSGSQNRLLTGIRDSLMTVVTLSEAGIDFSDQDLEELSLPRLKDRLLPILKQLEALEGSFDRGKRFLDGVAVSIFGLPNAGKSSLFNALLGEDRAIVSTIAGTTRDVVREKIQILGTHGAVTLKVADTAGLRNTEDSIEQIGIERSLQSAKAADVVIVVFDPDANPEALFPYLNEIDFAQKKVLSVWTKSDLFVPNERMRVQNQIRKNLAWDQFGTPLWVSSQTLEGIKELATELADQASDFLKREQGEVVLTQFEQVRSVQRTRECLNRALTAQDDVLFAGDLRHGLNEMGALLGETVPDDILGKIFSEFCIGK